MVWSEIFLNLGFSACITFESDAANYGYLFILQKRGGTQENLAHFRSHNRISDIERVLFAQQSLSLTIQI